MMKRRKLLIALAVLATTVSGLGVSSVMAQAPATLSETQLQQIRTNCTSTTSTLARLRTSDTLLRVNRGQLYETISTRLMNNFNGRVVSNGGDVQGLLTTTNAYKVTHDQFKVAYSLYARQLEQATQIDCATQPEAFYLAVVDARDKRAAVHTLVVRLNAEIGDYRTAVGTLRGELTPSTEAAR